MLYTKIKIEDKYYPKRLYRVVLIKGNPRLSILGAVFGKIFEAWFEHYFMFRRRNESFVANSWLNQFDPMESECSISYSYLDDLGEEFEYEYDTGEGYEFRCKRYKKQQEINREDLDEDEYPDVIVIEGKGAGIFEDNHGMLDDYLGGRIPPEFCEEDEDFDNFLVMPDNLDLEKLGDFDNELDLENYELFYDDVEYIAKRFDDEEIENMEYEEDDDGFDEWMLREEVADDVFNNIKINTVFRDMIKNIDINDAYEILVSTYKEVDKIAEENNYSDEDYEKLFSDKINSLIKH